MTNKSFKVVDYRKFMKLSEITKIKMNTQTYQIKYYRGEADMPIRHHGGVYTMNVTSGIFFVLAIIYTFAC